MNFTLPESFTKTFTVSKSEEEGAPSVEVTATFKISPDLTIESLLAKLARPEVIKAQGKLRAKWNKKEDPVKPSATAEFTIGNDDRVSDPLLPFRAILAKKRGIKSNEVSDEDALKVKAILEQMEL